MTVHSPLQPFLTLAGAVMTARDGRPVAAHYGSASGELAVCVRNVGLVARTDLSADGIERAACLLDPVAWQALGLSAASLTAIGVVGRRAHELLVALGAYGSHGDPLEPAPVTATTLAGVPVLWLHRSARDALALVPSDSAGEVWQQIEAEGRGFGLSCVGIEAAERFALLDRRSPTT